jgi:2-polyprenyl-3-methyl-5-hydroxy-6-metoxy-1,4-benzoquinol methylase
MAPHRLDPMYSAKGETYYRTVHQEMSRHLPAKIDHLLELGCGTGATSAYLKASGRALRVTGMELFEAAAAQAELVLDEVIVGDIETNVSSLPKEEFDVILANDILEHFVDPWSVVQRLASSLRPGGRVVARIPNARHVRLIVPLVMLGQWNYEEQGIFDRTHLRFFTKTSMDSLFCQPFYEIQDKVVYGMGKRPGLINKITFSKFEDLLTMHYVVTARKS